MMMFETPRIDLTSKAIGGEEATLREVFDATDESIRLANNAVLSVTALTRAYDDRIDAVKKATGVELENPYNVQPTLGMGILNGRPVQKEAPYVSELERTATFQTRLEELAQQYPEQADIIAPHRPVPRDAEAKSRAAEKEFEDTWSRSSGGSGAWAARLAGGFYGMAHDPINVVAMAFGGGPAAAGAKGLLWMALKQGAINAGAEAVSQPFVQSWRKQAGLPYGVGLASTNVAMAALFGAGLDATVRGAVRGVRRAAGNPYFGPEADAFAETARSAPEGSVLKRAYGGDANALRQLTAEVGDGADPQVKQWLYYRLRRASGKPSGEPAGGVEPADGPAVTPASSDLPPLDALDKAAADAPEGSLLKRARQGDEEALRDLAQKTGADADHAVQRALAELENEKLSPAPLAVDNGRHMAAVAQSIREQSGAAELPVGDAVMPRVTRPMDLISNDAVKPASSFKVEGKPVEFRNLDPASIKTDAAMFQFKSGGDAAGVTDRLSRVERWDQISAGKSIVYERANGELVIADGHQRLGLAKRLSSEGQDAKLDAYIFREADGWTPEDVRAYAALKNMRELSGHSIDMARIMRERPDLIDGSLPLSDAKIKEATMLARLSPEAFDAVVAGRLPSGYAALIGESVADVTRHAGLLNEMAAADLGNINQARLYLRQLMELPTTVETQLTLFGEESFTRTVLIERSKVLDGALRLLRADKRIFGLLEREAKAIGAAGNVLAREINEARAANAAQLAELIETLATSKGTVATILNDAAAAVARGLNATNAAKAFVKRVGDILDKEGINGLLRADEAPAPDLAPVRMDDPVGPEAREQIADLEAAAEGQESLFALPVTKRQKYATLGETADGVPTYARPEGQRLAEVRPAAGGEGRAVGEGGAAPGVSARRGEGVPDIGAQGSDARILRTESGTFRDDGSIIAGRIRGEKGRDAPGVSGDGEIQKVGETDGFEIRGFHGRVTAENVMTAQQLRDARLDPSREKLSQLVYRVYDADADIPSGKEFSARDLAEKEIARARIAQHLDGTWEVQYVKAAKPRKGIATKLYKAIEDDLGIRMSPSGTLTKDGLAFWKKRSPASVQWHTWSSADQFYVSPRWISDRLDDIGLDLATIKNRPVPHPMDAIDTRSLLDERKRLMVMYGKLPAEARAAKETMFSLPGFYSPAIRAAQAIRQEKGTGEQFWKQITKVPGVKKDELDTMMLEDFLRDKKSITKDEVLAYMRAHQVDLEERVLGEGDRGDVNTLAREAFDEDFSESYRWGRGSSSLNDWLDDYSRDLRGKYDAKLGEDAHKDATPTQIIREVEGQESLDSLRDEAYAQFESNYREAAQRRLDDEALYDDHDSTKFSGYKITGGENYRELLIRYPKLEGKYTSKHFEDQEIVHIRVDDRTGPNGEKVLFINEVQSDLHQKARKYGYKGHMSESDIAEFRKLSEKIEKISTDYFSKYRKNFLNSLYVGDETATGFVKDANETVAMVERWKELTNKEFRSRHAPPSAPFKGDLWLELALKRALQYAAENGYDAISWARSEQIAKAVGTTQEKLALQYDQKIGKFLDRYTKKWGGKVEGPEFESSGKVTEVSFEEDWRTNSILRITPEMRTAIAEGQPLFSAAKPPVETPSLHGSTLSARAAENMADIRAEIDKVISKVLPPEWKAEVRENLTFGDLAPGTRRRNPGVPPELEIEGTFDPYERIIYVSTAALDPVERAFEEAGHALKASRLIPDADYDILRAKAQEIGARERFGIDERYGEVYGQRFKDNPARLESALEEEAIMQMVAARARGDTFGKPVNAILDRVIKFLRAVRDALGIKGFRTFEDVFEDITEGRFAQLATEEASVAGRFQAASEVMASVGKGKKGAGEAAGEATDTKGVKPKETLTARQQGKLTRQIINEAAAEGKLTREDADSLIERLGVLEKANKDAKKATDELVKEIDAEALHRKRQAALTEQAKRRVDQALMNFRDSRGQADPAKAVVAMIENLAQHELPQGTMAMQNHFHAIFGMAMADLDGMLHEFKKTFFTGRTSNKARLSNVVRELFGEDTGDVAAKTFAAAAADVMEKMRLRFNTAGGSIGKLEGWALPQWHDQIALIRAGRDAWIEAITPELDLARMRNPLTGGQMTAADLRQSLEWIYKNITSDGWAEREATMAFRGLGSIANQRGDSRFLVFKNADAWMKYAERFGVGDDPLSVIVNHIKGMSKDIAAMEVFGPNPRAMLTYMQQWVMKQAEQRLAGQPAHFPAVTEFTGREFSGRAGSILTVRSPVDYAKAMTFRAENMYNLYRGHASGSLDSGFANTSQTIRNVNVLTKLGGAAVSAVGDLFWQTAARKFAGLPVTRIIGDVLNQIKAGGEREARRAGIITETYLHMHNEAAREAAATTATRITEYLADRVLTVSGLNGITRAGNHAMAMGIFSHMADQTAKVFGELDGPIQRMMRRHGLDAPDWEAIRLDASGKPVTSDFLTPTAVREALTERGLDPLIAERYLAMAIQEAQYATLTTTLRGRSFMYQGTRGGTIAGEILRHLSQFKGFAINLAILQIERMAREFVQNGFWRGAQYGSYALIAAVIGGALIEQLQQMRAGKDPRDMTKKEFWASALYRSGGLSIWGDLLYASENRFGGGIAQTAMGPTVDTIKDIVSLTYGSASKSFMGEKTTAGREIANIVRRYTPGTSLWYVRQAWNRVLMDNLLRMLDPNADAAFKRQILKTRRDYGQEFWWAPGNRSPERAPNIRAVVPAH